MKKIYIILIGLMALSLINFTASAKISDGDRQALEGLYDGTHGAAWTGGTGWTNKWPWDAETKKFTADPVEHPELFPGLLVKATTGYVTEIHLANNNLVGSIPTDFKIPAGVAALNYLKVLDISDNPGLNGEVPSEFIGFMERLDTLKMAKVHLTGPLPDTLQALLVLRYMDISFTGISSLPASIGAISQLTYLNLASNVLTALPAEIYNLSALTTLNLSNNQISDIPVLPAGVTASSATITIDVSNNQLDFCDLENLRTGFPNAIITVGTQTVSSNINPIIKNVPYEGSITLDANVCGAANTYQWKVSSSNSPYAWDSIIGATLSTLQLSTVTTTKYYSCSVKNTINSALSIESRIYKVVPGTDYAPDVTFYYDEDQVGALTNFPNYATKLKIQGADPNYSFTFNSDKVVTSTTPKEYHPTPNFFGDDLISYITKVNENNYNGYLTMTLAPVDDAPVLTVTPPAGAIMEEGKYVVTFGDSLVFTYTYNDTIDMGRACYNYTFIFPSTTNTAFKIVKSADKKSGTITYKPALNPEGISDKLVKFKVQEACDGGRILTSNLNSFTVRVKNKPANNAPIVDNTLIIKAYPSPTTLETQKFPATDVETGYDGLAFTFTQPAHGGVSLVGNYFSYTPTDGFVGDDVINYTVSDNVYDPVPGVLTINVAYPPQQDPIPEQVYDGLAVTDEVWTVLETFPYDVDASFLLNQKAALYLNSEELVPNEIYILTVKETFKNRTLTTSLANAINNKAKTAGTWTYNYKGSSPAYFIGTQNVKLELAMPTVTAQTKSGQLAESISEESNIVVTNDTVDVIFGQSIDLLFPAFNFLTGQLQMQVVGQPKQGSLNEFVFDTYEDELFTSYKGTYTPSSNKDVYDVITYLVSNGEETVTATKTIHITPVKKAPVITTIANKQIAEDNELSLVVPVTDEDNSTDELAMEAVITPVIEGFFAEVTNGRLLVIPPENFNGSVFVKVTATDPDQQSDYQIFILDVTPVNDPPALYIPKSSYTIDYNKTISLEISASDIDDDENLSVSFTDKPDWLDANFLDNSYVVLSGTPADTDAGLFTIGVSANDGTDVTTSSFKIKVNGPIPDNPPKVTSLPDDIQLPKKSAPYTIDLSTIFTDADSDPMQFIIVENNNTDWLSASLSGNIVTITIVDANYTGYANIKVQAESKGLSASTTINIFTPDNAPVAGDALPQIIGWKNDADYLVDLTAAFSDSDGDELSYSVESVQYPDVITVTIEGTIARVHFNEGKGGTIEVYIKAEAYGKSATNGFIVTIKDAAPVLKQGVANQSMFKNDQPLSVDLTNLFTDSDDPSVAMSVSSISNPGILTALVNNNTLVITPTGTADGTTDITILGTSGTYTIEYTFQITVNDLIPVVDQAPGDQMVPKNSSAFELDLSKLFKDEDDPYVSLAISSVVDNTLFTYTLYGYTLTITPIAGKSGTTNMTITGTASGKSVDYTFKITLEDKVPIVNKAVADQGVLKNSADIVLDLSDLFTDADDTDMTLAVKSVSNTNLLTATISGTSLTIKIAAGKAGKSDVTIQGTSGGKTIDDTFSVTVTDQTPVATAIPAVKANENDAPATIDLSSYFSDPDGDALTYEVTSNSKTTLIGTSIAGSILTIQFKADQFGTADLVITATADAKTVTGTISITVDEKLGVDEPTLSEIFDVYPNPVSNQIVLKWKGTNAISLITVNISDITGRIVMRETIESLQPTKVYPIEVKQLSSGIYFMNFMIESRTYNYRFIKR